jgi:hypothetical protein
VPVTYFYEGLDGDMVEHAGARNGDHYAALGHDPFSNDDTLALVRAFYTLNDGPRQRLLDLAKAMSGDN